MRRYVRSVLLVLLVLVVAGCGQSVQVQVPPKAPVEGVRSIVILPFDNVSPDASLAYEIEERVAETLRSSGWYTSVQTLRQAAVLPVGQPITFEAIRNIEAVAKADAVIMGTATYYFEDVYMNVPQCSGCDRPDINPSWSVSQATNVIVRFTGRVIDVATGRELHALTASGEDTDYMTHFLSHRGYTPPPEALIPRPNRQRVPNTRSWAIDRAVRQFTRDLLPTYEWRSVD